MNPGLIMGPRKKVPWHHYLWPEQAIDQMVDILVVEHGLRYLGRDMFAQRTDDVQADTFEHVRAVKNRLVGAEESLIETFDYRLLLLRGLIIRIRSKVIDDGIKTLMRRRW
jgi:hypothetical protein